MTRIRTILLGTMALAAVALGGGATLSACSSEPEYCRFDPDCGGGVGSFCGSSDDCDDGFCCTEMANCGGGMCTFHCDRDEDCPGQMACQHDVCFFICDSDDDCASGQSCEHDMTVCEWP